MCSPVTGPGASEQFQKEFMALQMGNSQDAEPIPEPANPSSASVVSPSISDRFTGDYDLMRKIAMQTSDPYEAANIMSNCSQFNLFNDESFWLEWSRRYLTVHGLKHVKSDVWLRCSSDSLGHRICKLSSLLFGTKAFKVKDTFLNRASTVEKISRRLECAVGCGLEIAAVRLFREREYGFRKKNKIISAALDQEQPHVAIELALECIKDNEGFLSFDSDLLVRIFRACIDTHSTAVLQSFSERKQLAEVDGSLIADVIKDAIFAKPKGKPKGTNALEYAIKKGNSEAVECILQMGFNKDASDFKNALKFAAGRCSLGSGKQLDSQSMRERLEMLYHLLKVGRNFPLVLAELPYLQPALDFLDKFYLSERDKMITATQIETASKIGKVLIKGNHPIFLAKYDIKRGDDLSIVEYFIRGGVPVNTQDDQDATLFHYATMSGNLKAMSALIKFGADPHMSYKENHPIFISTQLWSDEKRLSIIKFFPELGVDINIEDNAGKTLIAQAAFWGELDTLNGLLELGADVNKLVNKRHPIFFADPWCNWRQTLQFFLDSGFDIHTEDPTDGDTLLLKTMKRKEVNGEDVQFLLERGANLRLANSRGESGISIADERGISKLLGFIPDPVGDA